MLRMGGFGLLFCYLGYAALMVHFHTRFIYPFAQDRFSMPGFQAAEVPGGAAGPVRVQVHKSARADAPVVLIFMGNLGALDYFKPMLAVHLAADRNIIAMEYRGGGGLPGSPSEAQLKQDALAVFDDLAALIGPAKAPVFLHGYSLGTGLAIHVAANRPVAGIMLDAPFARLCEVMTQVSWLPACYLPFVQKWDSLGVAGRVSAPVLIQHGDADQRIPPAQGQKLAEAIRRAGGKVDMRLRPGGTHTNLAEFPDYADLIAAFIGNVTGG